MGAGRGTWGWGRLHDATRCDMCLMSEWRTSVLRFGLRCSMGYTAVAHATPVSRRPASLPSAPAPQELKWDLAAWRAEEEDRLASGQAKAAVAESLEAGFEALAADGGAGWDLLGRLLAYKPTDRWEGCMRW